MQAWARALLTIAVVATAGAARADGEADPDKRACVQAYEEAQRRRLASDLPGAREELRVCSRDVCPALVRSDCVMWLREVEAAVPSVIFSVRSPAGADLPDARVFVDGQPARPRVAGGATELAPGRHRVRVEVKGEAPVEREFTVNVGEKNRLVSVVVGAAEAASPLRPLPPRAPWPVAGVVLGAIGVVGLGVGVGVDIAGTVELHHLRSTCAPGCSPADVDATRTRIIVGDTVLGVGVVSLGVATILILTRGHRSPATGGLQPSAWSVAF